MRLDLLDRSRLEAIFAAMDEKGSTDSRDHQILCIFGAAAILLYGSFGRQTQDIDIWRPASRLNDRALKQLSQLAGLDYNPTEIDPARAYLQVVDDGVVRLPTFNKESFTWASGEQSQTVWSGDTITVVAPPPAIVAAAKMVRAEPQDIEDVIFLMNAKAITVSQIARAIRYFPLDARERAEENLVLLELATPSKTRSMSRDRSNDGYGR